MLIKDRYQCFASMHCYEYKHLKTLNIYDRLKTLHRKQNFYYFFYYIWKTKYKSCQIMWRLNTRACIRTISVVCSIYSVVYPMSRFTCTSSRECLNSMKHPIQLCLCKEGKKRLNLNIYQMTMLNGLHHMYFWCRFQSCTHAVLIMHKVIISKKKKHFNAQNVYRICTILRLP